MKAMILAAAGAVLLVGSLRAEDAKPALANQKQKASYAIGMNIGSSFKKQTVEVDLESLVKGLKDGISGGTALLTEKEITEVMEIFQKDMMAKQAAKADVAKKAGVEFLEANKKKDGVKTTSSGLQYKVIKEGTGPKPKESDTVKVNYRGTLPDGTEFDSSYKRNEPATFPLNGVIRAWTEGLQLMPVGSKYELYVPSELGYGAGGAGGSIPPNSTLIFEVELISIEK